MKHPPPPKKNSRRLFVEIDKIILKLTWKCRRPKIAKTLEKNKVGGVAIT